MALFNIFISIFINLSILKVIKINNCIQLSLRILKVRCSRYFYSKFIFLYIKFVSGNTFFE